MSANPALAGLFGLGAGLGLLLVIKGLTPAAPSAEPSRLAVRLAALREGKQLLRAGYCALAAVAALVLTGWISAAVLAFLGTWALPPMLGRDKHAEARLAKIEAVAVFTELLRDTLSAAAGLEQSLLAAAPAAPPAIRPHALALSARITGGARLPEALRQFGADVADPVCDLVVAALVLASQNQAHSLADLLSSLAKAARDKAAVQLRTAASRAKVRTSVRAITAIVLGMAVGLMLFDRSYLAPYSSPVGQLMLLVVGAVFAGSFVWLAKIARGTPPPRFLTRQPDKGTSS